MSLPALGPLSVSESQMDDLYTDWIHRCTMYRMMRDTTVLLFIIRLEVFYLSATSESICGLIIEYTHL